VTTIFPEVVELHRWTRVVVLNYLQILLEVDLSRYRTTSAHLIYATTTCGQDIRRPQIEPEGVGCFVYIFHNFVTSLVDDRLD